MKTMEEKGPGYNEPAVQDPARNATVAEELAEVDRAAHVRLLSSLTLVLNPSESRAVYPFHLMPSLPVQTLTQTPPSPLPIPLLSNTHRIISSASPP